MEPVVFLLHGIFGNEANYRFIEPYLRKKGLKTYPYVYKDGFGSRSQRELAREFAEYVEASGEERFSIFAISQGAIIAALALEELGLKERCKLLIALNAPFNGTYLAHLSKREGIRGMRRDSPLLAELREKMAKSSVRYVTIWNPLDMVILPPTSARLASAHKTRALGAPFHVTYAPFLLRDFVYEELTNSFQNN